MSLITHRNPKVTLSISDLYMAEFLLGWGVLEGVEVTLRHIHVSIYSDNLPAVAWNKTIDVKISKAAVRLLWALALQQRACRTSPFLTLYKAVTIKDLSDIP